MVVTIGVIVLIGAVRGTWRRVWAALVTDDPVPMPTSPLKPPNTEPWAPKFPVSMQYDGDDSDV